MKPCFPSVVSGAISFGSRSMMAPALDGVFHSVLGETRMDRHARDDNIDAVGREGLILDMAGGLAIHRIGIIGAELLQVDLVDAAADLFVRRKEDLDRSVLDVGIIDEDLGCGHDFRQPRLVVGAEQGRAVGGDDVVADLVFQLGMLGDADHPAWIAGKQDIPARIIRHHLRLDVPAREVRRSIHMRAEADDRDALIAIGRNGRIHIAVLVEMRIRKADL